VPFSFAALFFVGRGFGALRLRFCVFAEPFFFFLGGGVCWFLVPFLCGVFFSGVVWGPSVSGLGGLPLSLLSLGFLVVVGGSGGWGVVFQGCGWGVLGGFRDPSLRSWRTFRYSRTPISYTAIRCSGACVDFPVQITARALNRLLLLKFLELFILLFGGLSLPAEIF